MLPHDATAPENETATAARLVAEFGGRTGLTPAAPHPRRYLWTDAFAVLNFLELHARTGDESNRRFGDRIDRPGASCARALPQRRSARRLDQRARRGDRAP